MSLIGLARPSAEQSQEGLRQCVRTKLTNSFVSAKLAEAFVQVLTSATLAYYGCQLKISRLTEAS